jgi:hypothetical protein
MERPVRKKRKLIAKHDTVRSGLVARMGKKGRRILNIAKIQTGKLRE